MKAGFEEIFGANAGFVEEQYNLFAVDPALVDDAWRSLFSELSNSGALDFPQPTPNAKDEGEGTVLNGKQNGFHPAPGQSRSKNGAHDEERAESLLQAHATKLIESYRHVGHLRARISPLPSELDATRDTRRNTASLDIPVVDARQLRSEVLTHGFLGRERMAFGELVEELPKVYCGAIGVELSHIVNDRERNWLIERFELSALKPNFGISSETRRRACAKLIEAELFEAQLHKRYVGAKRFSGQGTESVVALLDRVFEFGVSQGLKEVVCGMAHRGRLAVLCGNLKKPLEDIFSEFEDRTSTTVLGFGDVKYHLGHRGAVPTESGIELAVELLPNPSHLEAVNPVVLGVVRARQERLFNGDRRPVAGILIHGDAAVIGQGIVPESLNLCALKGYETGGTLHIVLNNQVGFTTNPEEARSTNYCTEWAKAVEAPIFHVNAEDIDAVVRCAELATEFRQTFGRDVVIDLVGWRKYGHNEGDDPTFTQPLLYQALKERSALYVAYLAALEAQGIVDGSYFEGIKDELLAQFEGAQAAAKDREVGKVSPVRGSIGLAPIETGVSKARLAGIAETIRQVPSGFTMHPKLLQINEKRVDALLTDEPVDWGLAETLALGSLIQEGKHVRISGQDVGRGTFSHRHLMMRGADRLAIHLPLSTVPRLSSEEEHGTFEIVNSPLSEEAVLGFEFGYASTDPKSLVIWEAQFGDFANGAQIQIDQFISSSEVKWGQYSGVVLLLPHGFEGQGPEHSSARLERFLQLCAESNMTVAYPSNAAQYFHLLRRHALGTVGRPLVVMTPKSLLRLPSAMSPAKDFTSGSWRTLIVDSYGAPSAVAPTILCTGKVYYDLHTLLTSGMLSGSGIAGARVVRVEQLYPFPVAELEQELPAGVPLFWLQEEPRNMGAWGFMSDRLKSLGRTISYLGRPESPSPATGSPKFHAIEQERIFAAVKEALR